MKTRLKKKIDKANAFYEHQPFYTPREVMHSFYWWKRYLRKTRFKYVDAERLGGRYDFTDE